MFLDAIGAIIKGLQGILYLTRQHIGKEAEAPHVDAKDGNFLRPHPACRLEKRTITSHGNDIIHVKVQIVEHASHLQGQALLPGDEVVKGPFHVHCRPPLGEERKNFLYCRRLLGLIFIAEKGKSKFPLVHLVYRYSVAKIRKNDYISATLAKNRKNEKLKTTCQPFSISLTGYSVLPSEDGHANPSEYVAFHFAYSRSPFWL